MISQRAKLNQYVDLNCGRVCRLLSGTGLSGGAPEVGLATQRTEASEGIKLCVSTRQREVLQWRYSLLVILIQQPHRHVLDRSHDPSMVHRCRVAWLS